MCKNCIGTMFRYKKAHELHGIQFNSEFIKNVLDYSDYLSDRKDDWRFFEEWGWIVTGARDDDGCIVDHEGVWTHYLCHADSRYGEITSVGPDGTVDNPCGKVCEFNSQITVEVGSS